MMSLVSTNANMFGPDGIYANSQDKTLEVPGSFEYFNASAIPWATPRLFQVLLISACMAEWAATPNI